MHVEKMIHYFLEVLLRLHRPIPQLRLPAVPCSLATAAVGAAVVAVTRKDRPKDFVCAVAVETHMRVSSRVAAAGCIWVEAVPGTATTKREVSGMRVLLKAILAHRMCFASFLLSLLLARRHLQRIADTPIEHPEQLQFQEAFVKLDPDWTQQRQKQKVSSLLAAAYHLVCAIPVRRPLGPSSARLSYCVPS